MSKHVEIASTERHETTWIRRVAVFQHEFGVIVWVRVTLVGGTQVEENVHLSRDEAAKLGAALVEMAKAEPACANGAA